MWDWFRDSWRRSVLFRVVVVVGTPHLLTILVGVPYGLYINHFPYAQGPYRLPLLVEGPPSVSEPWPAIAPPEGPLPRLLLADLDTYFFPPEAVHAENGLAIWRFEGERLALSSSDRRANGNAATLAYYRLIEERLENLPAGYMLYGPDSEGTTTTLAKQIRSYPARKEYKESYRYREAWESYGPIGEQMEAIGCWSAPDLPRRGFGDDERFVVPPETYALEHAFIATWHRLDEPTVDHCLFKALLVALGLHPTEGFFFKEGPVTPEEQARALAALQLVYHPAVKPGMTKDEFVGALLAEGLIDP